MPKPTLRQIADAAIEEHRLEGTLQQLVNDARSQGYTWQEIGDAAGMAKQVAHTRWTNKGRESARSQQRKIRASARGEFVTDDDAMTRKRPTS